MNTKTGAHTTRLIWLAVGGFVWAVLIFARLVQLQIVKHSEFERQAERQQQRRVEVRAPRGTVFDRTGRPIAMSLPADTVCINPRRVPDRAVAADILSNILDLDRKELLEKIQVAAQARRGFLPIKKRVSTEESDRLRSLGLDWIEFRTESQRFYPNGTLAANLIGTVDFEERGNLGLEQSLDKDLRGRAGAVKMLTDVRQRGIESEVSAPAQAGTNITLSIDERVQFAAERELLASVEANHATSGSIVVMDPANGDILGMASYPTFDPNKPPAKGDAPSARFNQAVSVPFEPGSVFKVITLAAALNEDRITPDTLINCGRGRLKLFGRVIHEAKHGYGTLSAADVLAKSSNIGAIQIGLRLGNEKLLEYVRKFGFGKSSGIPLPAESYGMVRDLRYWGKSSIGSVAMGHEISTTSVQLARACSAVANGGLLVKPRLILRRHRPGSAPVNEPLPPPVRILKPETALKMRLMMEGVVLNGTGKKAKLEGYTSAGKTGSAQIFDLVTKRYTHQYNASFIGFAPVTKPRIVIAVTLNGVSLFGGVVAAPVFHNVAMETLRVLDVPKDLPESEPQPESAPVEADDLAIADLSSPPADLSPAPVPETPSPVLSAASVPRASSGIGSPMVPVSFAVAGEPPAAQTIVTGPKAPSFLGKPMRTVLEESVSKGVRVEVLGSGIARTQMPPPGSFLAPGQRVRVHFSQ